MDRATSPTKAGLDRPDMGHWFFSGAPTRQGCLSPLALIFLVREHARYTFTSVQALCYAVTLT
jgi:hypothetical protein